MSRIIPIEEFQIKLGLKNRRAALNLLNKHTYAKVKPKGMRSPMVNIDKFEKRIAS